MCLILLAWQAHADYPLVVAANRDEFLARPASPSHWWTDLPQLLAGRDLEAGGTWMGISRNGRFAALTNYRDPSASRPHAPSRGALVRDCLTGTDHATTTLGQIASISDRYAGFNLLFSDGQTLGIHESTRATTRLLDPGVYGLSNHLLDTPWPKVRQAGDAFKSALTELPDVDGMLALLRNDRPAPDEALPQTGVSAEWERWLSPVFIRASGYGTRCSSVLMIRQDGEVTFNEWTWNASGDAAGQVTHRFSLGVSASQYADSTISTCVPGTS